MIQNSWFVANKKDGKIIQQKKIQQPTENPWKIPGWTLGRPKIALWKVIFEAQLLVFRKGVPFVGDEKQGETQTLNPFCLKVW